ncbi:MAG: bifunctional nuclease family protein [Hydrogenothermaceae bacterium]|nr:bifunctional nuclease family protein [Hydrogenothermaceae bacterium]
MIQVVVKSIAIDNITGSPILLLSNVENEKELYPIWIGVAEAEGIVINQSGFQPPRPLTYDLFKNTIEALGGVVKAVEIADMVENAYIANIIVDQNGKEIVIDARPSDAVNLALRFNAPIYLNEEIVKKVNLDDIVNQANNQENFPQVENKETPAQQISKEQFITDEDLNKFKEILDNIKPEDFLIDKSSQ